MAKEVRLALVGDVTDVPSPLLHASATEAARFEAVCDPSGSQIEKAARICGARWPFDDLEQMLREAEPDAVIIAAPPDQRTQWAKTCLRRRTAVLMLGAPGSTPAACRTLSRLARQVNRQVMVGVPQRFSPAGVRAQRLLASGRLGPVVAADVVVTWARRLDRDPSGASALPFDLVFEAADRLQGLDVVPERVWAVERPNGHLAAIARTADGAVASLGLHHAGPPESAGSRLEARSDEGGLLIIDDDVNLICTVGSQLVARHRPRLGVGADPRVECGYAGMLGAFVTAVRDRQGVPFGLPSATGSVALAAAMLRSARTGRRIDVTRPS